MATSKRNVILINKRFQLKFSFFVCSWIFGLSIIYPLVIYNLFDFFFRYMAVDPNGPQLAVLKSTRNQMMIMLVVLQTVFIGVIFLISLFLSHRIAGPLYKLGMYMKRVEQGKLEPVAFRKKDYFMELEEGFNQMVTGIHAHLNASPAAIEHLQLALEKLSPADTDARAEIEKALKQLLS